MKEIWFTAEYLENNKWVIHKSCYYNLDLSKIDINTDWRFSENSTRKNIKFL